MLLITGEYDVGIIKVYNLGIIEYVQSLFINLREYLIKMRKPNTNIRKRVVVSV